MGARPGRLTLSEADRRVLAAWATDCAERVLWLFETHAPGDPRPRQAIAGGRRFARGETRIGPVRALAAAAHAAARQVAGEPAAAAAARAAGHAAAVAHMGAHARGVVFAVLAVGLAAPRDPAAAEAAELDWQARHATPAVRAALGRMPAPLAAGGRAGALIRDLDARLVRRS